MKKKTQSRAPWKSLPDEITIGNKTYYKPVPWPKRHFTKKGELIRQPIRGPVIEVMSSSSVDEREICIDDLSDIIAFAKKHDLRYFTLSWEADSVYDDYAVDVTISITASVKAEFAPDVVDEEAFGAARAEYAKQQEQYRNLVSLSKSSELKTLLEQKQEIEGAIAKLEKVIEAGKIQAKKLATRTDEHES
jgi:hypothetical protein